jgi:transposase
LLRFLHRLNQSSDADDLRSPKAHLGTSAKWIQKYVDGGLDGLVEPIKHKVTSSLNDEQRQELRKMILNERPTKYGIDREIWTGETISEVIKQLWNIELKTSGGKGVSLLMATGYLFISIFSD